MIAVVPGHVDIPPGDTFQLQVEYEDVEEVALLYPRGNRTIECMLLLTLLIRTRERHLQLHVSYPFNPSRTLLESRIRDRVPLHAGTLLGIFDNDLH